MKINLNDILSIQCFVKGCEFYEGEIIVTQGRHVVNGRSFLGLHSLDLSNTIDVKINTTNKNVENDFYNFIKKWEVE